MAAACGTVFLVPSAGGSLAHFAGDLEPAGCREVRERTQRSGSSRHGWCERSIWRELVALVLWPVSFRRVVSSLRRGPRRCLVVLGLSGGGARRQKVRGPPSRLHSSLLMVVHHFCAFPKRRNRPGAELRGGTHVAFGRSVPEFRLVQSCAPRARFVRGCFWLSRRSDAMALQTPFRTPASLPESLWWRSRECDSVHARSAVAPEISRRRASR